MKNKPLFLRIAEPRVYRVFQSLIYFVLFVSGIFVVIDSAPALERIVGPILMDWFGILLIMGGLTGSISVLPGIWWLERVAILALVPALAMYIVMVASIPASKVSIIFSTILMLVFIQRWFVIKGSPLAPLAT